MAVAARGRPLGASAGTSGGLPAAFWDYLFTTFLIVVGLMMVGGLASLLLFRRAPDERKSHQGRTVRALVLLFLVATLVWIFGRHINLNHLLHPHRSAKTTATSGSGKGANSRSHPSERRTVHFRWEELVVVLVLLLGLGMLAARTRSRRGPALKGQAPEALAAALDESLDDLRSEADLRRAIVAAYARMEAALAAAGLPRRPAEAPLEYLERTLLSLDTSADAVRRLTELFQWARFSHHEPDPPMRDEAVDALVAVRDELRASKRVSA